MWALWNDEAVAVTTRVANGVRYATGDGYQAAVLPMKAHGKARPRVTVKGTFMPADYVRARDTLRVLFGTVQVRLPVALRVTAVRKLPAATPKGKAAALLWTWCATRPDCDNIEGWVMDALFPEDDSAVVWTECRKVWGPRDMVRIELWEVDTDERILSDDELAALE